MTLLDSLKGLFSGGGSAASLHKRAMSKAKREDWSGAIADYSVVISSGEASSELKAMAHFNRALAYSQRGQLDQAAADLQAILAMSDAPPNILSAAKEKLARWEKRRAM